ncbi:MAG: hypothetical protein L0216_03960 [Planctomycetales bacterium]|nr:hypothetical protein [Planctomycetales bacterium]
MKGTLLLWRSRDEAEDLGASLVQELADLDRFAEAVSAAPEVYGYAAKPSLPGVRWSKATVRSLFGLLRRHGFEGPGEAPVEFREGVAFGGLAARRRSLVVELVGASSVDEETGRTSSAEPYLQIRGSSREDLGLFREVVGHLARWDRDRARRARRSP